MAIYKKGVICMNKPKYTHGGYRPGAGSKKQAPPDATRRTFLLTDDEHKKVRELIQQLRAAE